jgi:hypothetical protein
MAQQPGGRELAVGEEDQLYERWLSLGRQAFGMRMYEAAFHSMAAAMYAARAMADDSRLMDVAVTASEHQCLLDDSGPTHHMASRRGRSGFFSILHDLAFHHHNVVRIKRFRPNL